jgi:hypothetical protein
MMARLASRLAVRITGQNFDTHIKALSAFSVKFKDPWIVVHFAIVVPIYLSTTNGYYWH